MYATHGTLLTYRQTGKLNFDTGYIVILLTLGLIQHEIEFFHGVDLIIVHS
jgi:hypothetical protein